MARSAVPVASLRPAGRETSRARARHHDDPPLARLTASSASATPGNQPVRSAVEENYSGRVIKRRSYRKTLLFDRFLKFDVQVELPGRIS